MIKSKISPRASRPKTISKLLDLDDYSFSEMSSPVMRERFPFTLPKNRRSMAKLSKKSVVKHSQEEVEKLREELHNLAGANKELNAQIELLKRTNYMMKANSTVKVPVSTQTEEAEDPFVQSLAMKLEGLYNKFKPNALPPLDYKTSSWKKCHKAIDGISELLAESQRVRKQHPVDFRTPIKSKW
mmetsp:Transcript_4760/g.8893  ORF Transcript_4760/g.8893 Transcript_4760/m.8893 type:complete len:185 (-) Transcript_4760:590-1144(-)